ncbi:MAG: nuclear transport factor 2 family protein [Betaproteobacteria bacterium]|nr:nuclear transport factor 2 family protein [Betaproteobacteria bacterium]
MHPHETLIREFYAAFARRDAEAMARCYHDEVFFSDPAFPKLQGEEARDMWRMLVSRAADLEIVLEESSGDAEGGRARWTARYTFTKTGRRVVNHVEALFAFRDGRIVRHYDRFSFWQWSSQALGPLGRVLGWSAPLKWMVRRQATQQLERFREKRGAASISGHRP